MKRPTESQIHAATVVIQRAGIRIVTDGSVMGGSPFAALKGSELGAITADEHQAIDVLAAAHLLPVLQ